MKEFRIRLGDLRDEIAATKASLTALRAECGEHALALGLPSSKPFSTLRSEHDKIVRQQSALVEQRDRIKAISERFTALNEERQTLERARRELTNDLTPLYQQVGEAAYSVYRDNPLIDEECAAIFAPAGQRYQIIKDLSSEIAQLEKELENKPFLDKMVTRGRIALLKNRMSSNNSSLAAIYRTAGRRIVETDFVCAIGDPSLTAAMEPFRELTAQVHRANEHVAALESEREALSQELDSLSALNRIRRRMKELSEEERLLAERQLDVRARVCEELENLPETEVTIDLPAEKYAAVGTTRTRLEELAKLEARLVAALEVERITEQIDTAEKDIKRREEQISTLQAEIESLDKERASLKRSLTAQRKKRGPLSELG
jgi:chromosome segregation ATPase